MKPEKKEPLTQKFWNSYAKSYNKVENLYPHREMLSDLVALIPAQSKSILDVGCGTGALLEKLRLSKEDADLYGVDFSDEMLEITIARV